MTCRLKNGQVIQLRFPVMIQDYNYGKVEVDYANQRIQYQAVGRSVTDFGVKKRKKGERKIQ